MNKTPQDHAAPSGFGVAKPGVPWTPKRRRAVCYHEAGHAVAAIVSGATVVAAAIASGGDLGDERVGVTGFDGVRATGYQRALIEAAGPVAEVRAVGLLPERTRDLANHAIRIQHLLAPAHLIVDARSRFLTFVRDRARRAVADNWSAVERIAALLEERDYATGGEIESIVRAEAGR